MKTGAREHEIIRTGNGQKIFSGKKFAYSGTLKNIL